MFEDPPRRRQVVLVAMLFEGGLGALAAGLGWLIGCPPWQVLHWNVWDALWAVAATVPLVVLFLLCMHWPVGPLARIKAIAEEFIAPLFRSCTFFDLAVISLLAGLGEEMLFRGALQGSFSRWFDAWLVLVCTSVLFGLLHWITPTYAGFATLMGGYLGWLFLESGNLLVPVVVHALYDGFALAYLVRSRAVKA
ncbi:MAG TPA: CPBP family intramembrane glutamic endopeptidase [Gemmataceae bacterium]|nr:CPBP family intramembrane glutamic endopeptidase [Gemmataceae bacterium]